MAVPGNAGTDTRGGAGGIKIDGTEAVSGVTTGTGTVAIAVDGFESTAFQFGNGTELHAASRLKVASRVSWATNLKASGSPRLTLRANFPVFNTARVWVVVIFFPSDDSVTAWASCDRCACMLTVWASMSLSARVASWVQPLPDLQYLTFPAFLRKCRDVCALTRPPHVTPQRIPLAHVRCAHDGLDRSTLPLLSPPAVAPCAALHRNGHHRRFDSWRR